MVIMNTAKETKSINLKRFEERTKGFSQMKDIFTGTVSGLSDITLDSYASAVYELVR